MKTLYARDGEDGLRIWTVISNEEGQVIVRHGKLGGKIQEKITQCKEKNIGKANETTSFQQAVLEAEAKYVKQKKSGYFETKEEALDFEKFTPMKAQNYNDHAKKLKFPCIGQYKLNGQRLMLPKDGKALSKQGEPLELPDHWKNDINELAKEYNVPLDGEVYAGLESAGGLSLQRIISAFRKPNQDTPKLKYYIYDIPDPKLTMRERYDILKFVWSWSIGNTTNIYVEAGRWLENQQEADDFYKEAVDKGYEGVVYRNQDGVYEFGKRSYNLIKRKPRQTAEAFVLSAVVDKNEEAIYNVHLENGITFNLKMKIDKSLPFNLRKFENSDKVVGQWIEFEYEELSDDGVPTKGVGLRIREVNKHLQPVE